MAPSVLLWMMQSVNVMKQAGLAQAIYWNFLHQTHVHATFFPRLHTSVYDHQSSAYITFLASFASAERRCANNRLNIFRHDARETTCVLGAGLG